MNKIKNYIFTKVIPFFKRIKADFDYHYFNMICYIYGLKNDVEEKDIIKRMNDRLGEPKCNLTLPPEIFTEIKKPGKKSSQKKKKVAKKPAKNKKVTKARISSKIPKKLD